MLQRRRGYLHARPDGPTAAAQLEREGHAMLRGVLGPDEVDELRRDVERVFDEYPPDIRRPESEFVAWDEFRYETVNRSAVVQRVVGHRDIAQRLHTTDTTNQASAQAIARAGTTRERTLIGLHPALFYDG